jgi:hypothetical protein
MMLYGRGGPGERGGRAREREGGGAAPGAEGGEWCAWNVARCDRRGWRADGWRRGAVEWPDPKALDVCARGNVDGSSMTRQGAATGHAARHAGGREGRPADADEGGGWVGAEEWPDPSRSKVVERCTWRSRRRWHLWRSDSSKERRTRHAATRGGRGGGGERERERGREREAEAVAWRAGWRGRGWGWSGE